ncbi:hypothetical protein DPMN_024666 [Dreissena polymorpha]|uniref:Uncharacterized protein n=1 Tax=Dreissena polymorpha TaxID=45954 RepID=A0A9D4LQ56_DREPO|nr:hypothetical protein DPMN_024666 [Dreissena polymorpha]
MAFAPTGYRSEALAIKATGIVVGQGRMSRAMLVPLSKDFLGTGMEVKKEILTSLGKPGGAEQKGTTVSRLLMRRSDAGIAGLKERND